VKTYFVEQQNHLARLRALEEEAAHSYLVQAQVKERGSSSSSWMRSPDRGMKQDTARSTLEIVFEAWALPDNGIVAGLADLRVLALL
jgi:hypothetical protein